MAFDDFCELNKCEHYRTWDFLFDDNEMPHRCYSCEKVGQSYNVEKIPDDCPYWNKDGNLAHYKAEAERLQKELDDVKPFVCSMVNKCPDDELKAMTALAKKYKRQRDWLIEKMKEIVEGSIWAKDSVAQDAITRIQEADGGR